MTETRYKNNKGEDVDVQVDVTTRPNLRDGTHEMLLYQGKGFLENIFDKKVIDEETESVFMHYPETWCNIPELQGLMKFVFHFYPNIKKLRIKTHSVYIIQNVYNGHVRVFSLNSEYPQTSDPTKHMSPPPREFNDGKISVFTPESD